MDQRDETVYRGPAASDTFGAKGNFFKFHEKLQVSLQVSRKRHVSRREVFKENFAYISQFHIHIIVRLERMLR